MPMPRSLTRWLRLPSRVALILGIGALSTGVAQADAPDQTKLGSFGGLSIRSEAGRIYLSEGGHETELRLSATPQRDYLLRLLEGQGTGGVKLDHGGRLLLSSGGGAGFSLWDLTKPFTGKPASGLNNTPPVSAPPNSPKRDTGPRNQEVPVDKKG
jgi:hypothetical protein